MVTQSGKEKDQGLFLSLFACLVRLEGDYDGEWDRNDLTVVTLSRTMRDTFFAKDPQESSLYG